MGKGRRGKKRQNKKKSISPSDNNKTSWTEECDLSKEEVTAHEQSKISIERCVGLLKKTHDDNKNEVTEREKLKEWIKNTHCEDFDLTEGLFIGRLEMKVEHKDEKNKVQKLSLGRENHSLTKVIMLIGATGTGKTTLINAMANYICGVDFQDDFRFTVVDKKDDASRSEAQSQTDYITAFAFYHSSGMPFDYNYILIDTPGFGDTRGIERDRAMMGQIETFLKQKYGIDQVDGIGFVIPASQSRLTQTQKYILDGLASMFGKDVRENVFVMATFADARKPPVLKPLNEAGMEYGEVYKFNNSALFARNKVKKYNFGDESESDEEDEVIMSRKYWDMATKSMCNFFTKVGQMMPVSLTLTKEVLEERRHLQTVLFSLQQQVHTGLSKLSNLNEEKKLLAQLDDDMKETKDHYMEIDVPKITEVSLRSFECVTNCLKCSCTCHFPCHLPKKQDKRCCSAMRNGFCKVCPANCAWDLHRHMDFRYETSWYKETYTADAILARYNKACLGKMTKKKVIHEIEKDIKDHGQELIKLIKDIQKRVERLEEIALKPNPLSTKEYIDLLVQSEKMQKLKNFEKRIDMLLKLKEEVQILEAATSAGETLLQTGEALLTHFQNLMTLQD